MKALLFNVNVPKFLIIQALRPISGSFCYRGPFSTVKSVPPIWPAPINAILLRAMVGKLSTGWNRGTRPRVTYRVCCIAAIRTCT